jgi:hypothetical protein
MEEHRRTEVGRVRTAKEFVAIFFPHDDAKATDKLFHLLPAEVRGPVLSTWGIRGSKAALKDSDEKVRDVVHDALVAGDIDEGIFEDGVTANTLIDWVALPDWWSFWRHGRLTGVAIQKALATARELNLIDDRWFLTNLQGRGGKLKGTDVVCDTLSKDQIVGWMRKLHESGDGSPAGMVAALGWETILTKTAQDALLFALDAFAKKAGLIVERAERSGEAQPPPASKKEELAPVTPVVNDQRTDAPEADAPPDSGLPVAIPDIPVIDAGDPIPPPDPPTLEAANLWGHVGESPKLVEARAKMMEMLGAPAPGNGSGDPWTESEVPEKPSALEWPEPPPIVAGVGDDKIAGGPKKGPAGPTRR